MSCHYEPNAVEAEVQKFWENNQSFKVNQRDTHPEKFYGLCAFPYPSGTLHVGHVRNYVLGDAVARYQRMQGKQVIHPIGWDAFGLPAENAALHHGIDPLKWTYRNIACMREQLKRLGLSYDWDRELTTCDPKYYFFEQWLFTQLLQKGLVYRKTSLVNWDPVDQTTLANEQVIEGRGWRSGANIEQRAIPQWFLKITDYAEELLKGLESLPKWPEAIKAMQYHWIGRSEGVIVRFPLLNRPHSEALKVFTTRIDTIMGVSCILIAKEHPLAQEAINPVIHSFITDCKALHSSLKNAQVKRGVFSGYYVTHPLTNTSLPVWIANFVQMDYGTGAVMAVPAHDTRDFEFAKQYTIPIRPVVAPLNQPEPDYTQNPYTKQGILINSGTFTGLSTQSASKSILDTLVKQGNAEPKTNYRLRDWGVSRQRYWGTPIPIIYCEHCGPVPVPLKDLPVVLPTVSLTKGKAPLPLCEMPEFYETTCPTCYQKARRETDTLDTFVESSWYFLRFLCPNSQTMVTPDIVNWLPVDHYIIGVEHAVLHLLYARFFYKVLYTLKLLPTKAGLSQEPFKEVLTQGMVLKSGAKMSKSKANVIDPTPLINQYGADTLRLFILFAAPPQKSLEWSDRGLIGGYRFLKRLWNFVHNQPWLQSTKLTVLSGLDHANTQKRLQVHRLLKLANQDYQSYQFNTIIAHCMKLLNVLESTVDNKDNASHSQNRAVVKEGLSILLRLLSPVVPHITHILWEALAEPMTIMDAAWPSVDETAIKPQTVSVVIQINGKRRALLEVDANMDVEAIKAMAFEADAIRPYLEKAQLQKVIVVPSKTHAPLLINLVLA